MSPNRRGLSNVLYDCRLAGLDQFLQPTGVPGLFVLPAGPATGNAANLLYSENLPVLLATFKKEFDMVIIDTPPMLQMPDARIVGRMADAVILVTRAGHTTRDLALAANQRFAEDRIRVLGTILNDWDPNKTSNGGYGYGRRYYYD